MKRRRGGEERQESKETYEGVHKAL